MLIVDDHEDTRSMYAWCLRAAGWIVAEAEDGLEAFIAARAFVPDAIVMDVHLPVADGLSVIRRIKEEDPTGCVRVLVCTGAPETEVETRAREAGCDDFVRKPCLPDQLRERLESMVTDPRTS